MNREQVGDDVAWGGFENFFDPFHPLSPQRRVLPPSPPPPSTRGPPPPLHAGGFRKNSIRRAINQSVANPFGHLPCSWPTVDYPYSTNRGHNEASFRLITILRLFTSYELFKFRREEEEEGEESPFPYLF